jgi:hypothetical protein
MPARAGSVVCVMTCSYICVFAEYDPFMIACRKLVNYRAITDGQRGLVMRSGCVQEFALVLRVPVQGLKLYFELAVR